jgi:hypothetical protein
MTSMPVPCAAAVHDHTHMMQPFAVLLEPGLVDRRARQRLQELDLRPGVVQRDERPSRRRPAVILVPGHHVRPELVDPPRAGAEQIRLPGRVALEIVDDDGDLDDRQAGEQLREVRRRHGVAKSRMRASDREAPVSLPAVRILVARCEIAYHGRATTRLGAGDRVILFKDDGSLCVHAEKGYKPLNYNSIKARAEPVRRARRALRRVVRRS